MAKPKSALNKVLKSKLEAAYRGKNKNKMKKKKTLNMKKRHDKNLMLTLQADSLIFQTINMFTWAACCFDLFDPKHLQVISQYNIPHSSSLFLAFMDLMGSCKIQVPKVKQNISMSSHVLSWDCWVTDRSVCCPRLLYKGVFYPTTYKT